MPLPSPKGTQKEDSFMQRCMSDNAMNKEYANNKQRAAVCMPSPAQLLLCVLKLFTSVQLDPS